MTAIRGATTSENNKNSIADAVTELVDAIFQANNLDKQEIVSVIFSVTRDINCVNPATIFRKRFEIYDTAMFCVQEAEFENSLDHCIRVLILTNQAIDKKDVVNCYLNNAINLPDLYKTI